MNGPAPAEIEAIERATMAALAHDCCEVIGPWILGLRPGPVGRAHTAAPLAHNLVRDEGLIARIEASYRARDMSAAFRVPDVEGLAGVVELLSELGYRPTQPTLVMSAAVAEVAALAAPVETVVLDAPDDGWSSVFLGEGFDPEEGAGRIGVLRRSPGATFGAVRVGDDTLAVGALNIGEGLASLHGMRTARAVRGQGLAGRVMARLAEVAQGRGVERMFLQVEEPNTPARALYGRAGFTPLWRYHYWRR